MNLRAHRTYLKSLLKHKWYVGIACFRMGLYWQGIVHDLSKFSPSEYPRYVRRFGGGINSGRDKTGMYDPTKDEDFKYAWHHHAANNRHHPTHWCVVKDIGNGTDIEVLHMPEKYLKEMLCDFWGASMAYNDKGKGGDIEAFWNANKDKFRMTELDKMWVDLHIEEIANKLNGN